MSITNVVVLLGGVSTERNVSLKSGKCVINELSKINNIRVFSFDTKYLSLVNLLNNFYDKVFIMLHGVGGEDGSIQGFLDYYNIPYTSSGVLTSAISIDKFKVKNFLKSFNINILPSFLLNKFNYINYLFEGEIKNILYEILIKKVGFPMLLKPNKGGSSIGIKIIKNIKDLKKNLNKSILLYEDIMFEKYIKGREYSVGIINGIILPVIEIIKKNDFFDYYSKYKSNENHCNFGNLNKFLTRKLEDICMNIWFFLECKGFIRVDFILDKYENFWFLEINTIPGMCYNSLIPIAAKHIGISYNKLLKIILFNKDF